MNAWINEIAGLTGMSCTGINSSLSDLSQLVPDTRFLWILGIAAAIYMVIGLDAWRFDHYHDQDSDADHK